MRIHIALHFHTQTHFEEKKNSMAFRVPQIPLLRKAELNSGKSHYKDVPYFDVGKVADKSLIGAGSYGKIYKGTYAGGDMKNVALKELSNVDDDDILKEAIFLSHLSHSNIVRFLGFCPEMKTLVVEYLSFILEPFGSSGVCTNLDELLQELNKCQMKGFEHLPNNVALQILCGLEYLHSQGISHRDVKPGNVLVSNRKIFLPNGTMDEELWQTDPITAKLTDFGESWGNILNTVARTHTVSVFKGTLAFMAPEIVSSQNKATGFISAEGMKLADIWSLGMLFFSLINPGNKVPFYLEFKENKHRLNKTWEEFIIEQILSSYLPRCNDTYHYLQATQWIAIYESYLACIRRVPSERMDLNRLKEMFLKKWDQSKSIPLHCHQGTAFEKAQENGLKTLQPFIIPENDGTNACIFFCLKVGEDLVKTYIETFIGWGQFADVIDHTISDFPIILNSFRNIEKTYDSFEAFELLTAHGCCKNIELVVKLEVMQVFSEQSRNDFMDFVETIDGIYIVTVPPYSFLLGWIHNVYCVIDTHSIPKSLGGNDNGLLIFFDNKVATVRWLWKRLAAVGVRIESMQIVQMVKKCETNSSVYGPPETEACQELHVPLTYQLVPSEANPERSSTNMGNSATASFWNKTVLGIFKNMSYIPSLSKKLTNAELLALVHSDISRCKNVPQACRMNAIFLIDSPSLKCVDDVKSDLNGSFYKCLEIKSKTVTQSNVGGEYSVNVKSNKKIELDILHMHLNVHRVENRFGLIRNISYFTNKQNEILNNTVILQYIVNKLITGNVDRLEFTPDPHGNRKNSSQAFYAVKKSTIDNIRNDPRLGKRGANSIFSDLNQDRSGDFGDYPRSKKQIADLACYNPRNSTITNEVDLLLAFNEELDDRVIWHHSDLPSDVWVIGTNRMIANLKNYSGPPLSVDPTFNHGRFEITPFTYRHPFIESRSKHDNNWSPAIMIGPTIIHHQKTEEVFDIAFRAIASKTDLRNKRIGILTDGEIAIINSLKSNFTDVVDLRCTNHFRQNCKDFLHANKIPKQDLIMELVFGEDGIIESESKHDLRKHIIELETILSDIHPSAQSFYEYLKNREKSVLRKLIRDNRRNGGMLVHDNVPERVYTNQSECVNFVLAAQKKSLGLSKKDDVSKTFFLKEVWMATVAAQDAEIERAFYGQSQRYRLNKLSDYLTVDVEKWFNMSSCQKERYITASNTLSVQEMTRRTIIPIPETDMDVDNYMKRNLSINLLKAVPFITFAETIQAKAEELLSSPSAITKQPSLDEITKNQVYLVAGKKETYKVSIKNKIVSCNCKGYKFMKLCSHSVAVTDKLGILNDLISRVKVAKRAALTYGEAGGRKGKEHRRKRIYSQTNYGSCASDSVSRPFTQVWHNNEPFVIINVTSIPKDKGICTQCQNEFPKGLMSIIPFDIAFRHQERWEFLNRNRVSEAEPKFLASPIGKMTYKYYCVSKECISKRFPYFHFSLIVISDDVRLKTGHFKLLKTEFNFNPQHQDGEEH